MFLLYVALGGTAVFTFPVTLWIDRIILEPLSTAGAATAEPTGATPMLLAQTKVIFGGFLLFLLFAVGSAILAILIGGGALPQHLSYAP
jgi:hypothetical protein